MSKKRPEQLEKELRDFRIKVFGSKDLDKMLSTSMFIPGRHTPLENSWEDEILSAFEKTGKTIAGFKEWKLETGLQPSDIIHLFKKQEERLRDVALNSMKISNELQAQRTEDRIMKDIFKSCDSWIKKKGEEWHYGNVFNELVKAQAERIIERLEKRARKGTSTHGNCCTCVNCKEYHDDCRCEEIKTYRTTIDIIKQETGLE